MEWKQILVLIVLYSVSLCGVAGVFWALEFRHEEQVCEETIRQLTRTFQKFENVGQTDGGAAINRSDIQELVGVSCTTRWPLGGAGALCDDRK